MAYKLKRALHRGVVGVECAKAGSRPDGWETDPPLVLGRCTTSEHARGAPCCQNHGDLR
jgi:hypothetical protein